MTKPDKLFKALENFRKLDMSLIPTPLHKLNKLSAGLGANIIYIDSLERDEIISLVNEKTEGLRQSGRNRKKMY